MLGNNIAKLRKEHKVTQQELADAIGVERTTLSRIENGAWQPSADTMKAISDFFRVPIGDVVYNPDVLEINTKIESA